MAKRAAPKKSMSRPTRKPKKNASSRATSTRATSNGPRATVSGKRKFVYFFGSGKADGNRNMKDLLGGKGANLAEMTNAALPVPPGFTISTEACNLYYKEGRKTPAAVDR